MKGVVTEKSNCVNATEILYRIAGNIGGGKTLAVCWCRTKFINIKSVKLKIRYKPHAIVAMLKYFKKVRVTKLPDENNCILLSAKELKEINKNISGNRGKYNSYTCEQRAQIGKYAVENGPTKAPRHFSKLLGIDVPEPTARRLKAEYLKELDDQVTCLATKQSERPLLLGNSHDKTVQDYINALREAGGVVNTAIVMAAAEGISAKDRSLLLQNGGHIEITQSWAKSLLLRMGYFRRKCSNAGKVSVVQFQELKENFIADIQAEVLMNDIPLEIISTGTRLPLT